MSSGGIGTESEEVKGVQIVKAFTNAECLDDISPLASEFQCG